MGLLNSSDWKAKWITYPSRNPETTAHFGYLSSFANTPNEIKWVQIDLGSVQGIDAIKLWGTWMTGRKSVPGGGFPYRFKIEVSENPDFSNARIVFDHSARDFPNPGLEPVLLDIGSHRARLIRLTATKLSGEYDPVWDPDNEKWKPGNQSANFLALSEMEVLKNGKNLAYGKSVTASDVWEKDGFNTPDDSIIAPYIHGGWSPQNLTNGRTEPDLGSRFHNEPVHLFRKEFTAGKTIRSARLYATALGAYEFQLNGKKIGDHHLAPAWTIQSKRVLYQTFDVTPMLNPGTNVLSAMLGDGWFRMRGWDYYGSNKRFAGFYNADDRWLLGQLEIEYTDGSSVTVATDETWQSHGDGPFQRTFMYDGVLYDARKELPGWDKPGLTNFQGWTNAVAGSPANLPVLSSQMMSPIRLKRELKPLSVKELKPGAFIYDFGEELAGICRIRVSGPQGSEVKLRFAQALRNDGSLYVENLMGSYDNQDVFILDGKGMKTFIPLFTYHGFRYVEVSGVMSSNDIEELTALEIGSNMDKAVTFSSTDSRLNKLVDIIDKAYLSIMYGTTTDCAARDERLPWLGDSFTDEVQSLCYMYDFSALGINQLRNIDDALNSNGVCPPTLTRVGNEDELQLACWSDSSIVAPYFFWLNYGDRRSLEKAYSGAEKLINHLYENNPDGMPNTNYAFRFGDWLSSNVTIPPDATAWHPKGGKGAPADLYRISWWVYIVEIVSKMAKALGKADESHYYAEIAGKARESLIRDHVKPGGEVTGNNQSSYALVLGMNHLQGKLKIKAEEQLIKAIHSYKDHLSTGSSTTHFMLNYLAENGHQDLAWKLVMQPTCPSYGHIVDSGTNTMWERFDSWHPELGFNPAVMNDLSHLGLNSVLEWILGYIGGIRPHPEHPGFKRFIIDPCTGSGPEWIKTQYKSLSGLISCQWKREGNHTELNIEVPPNTVAEVHIRAADISKIKESGNAVSEIPGIHIIRKEDKKIVLE
ncbi:MAG: family 78 glycoside hydrolase catalytic domain, partial [Bacteroidota bacterium]